MDCWKKNAVLENIFLWLISYDLSYFCCDKFNKSQQTRNKVVKISKDMLSPRNADDDQLTLMKELYI